MLLYTAALKPSTTIGTLSCGTYNRTLVSEYMSNASWFFVGRTISSVLFGLAFVIGFAGNSVTACECIAVSVCEQLALADVVFVGKVIDGGLGADESGWYSDVGFARMEVIEAFRGLEPDTEELDVVLGLPMGMCSPIPYRLSEIYLIAIKRRPDGRIVDAGCYLGIDVEEDPEALEIARAFIAGSRPLTIQGKVAANVDPWEVSYRLRNNRGVAIGGARVSAVSEAAGGKAVWTQTDKDGLYKFNVPEPGSYRLTATADGYHAEVDEEDEQSVVVRRDGCAVWDFGLWNDSSIQGRIVHEDGRAPSEVSISLLAVTGDELAEVQKERTDELGDYEFQHVAPGKYLVAVSPFGETAREPYKPRFYPGVEIRERAAEIEVSFDSKVWGRDLIIGERLETKVVHAVLRTEGGVEIGEGRFECIQAEHEGRPDYRPPDGEIKGAGCEVLADRAYRVRIEHVNRIAPRDQPTVTVPPGENDVTVRLTLSAGDLRRIKPLLNSVEDELK